MKKLSKKLIIVIVSVLSISLLSGFAVYDHKQEQEARLQKEYKEALTQYISLSRSVQMGTDVILSDYSSSWHYGIWSNRAGVSMESEIREAINDNEELANSTNKLFDKAKKNLKTISKAAQNNPDKYSEIYEESKKLYATMSTLMNQVEAPTGSLMTFNQNIKELDQEFEGTFSILETLTSDIIE